MKLSFFNRILPALNAARSAAATHNSRKPVFSEEFLTKQMLRFGLTPTPLSPEEKAKLIQKAKEKEASIATAEPAHIATEAEQEKMHKGFNNDLEQQAEAKRKGCPY